MSYGFTSKLEIIAPLLAHKLSFVRGVSMYFTFHILHVFFFSLIEIVVLFALLPLKLKPLLNDFDMEAKSFAIIALRFFSPGIYDVVFVSANVRTMSK